MLRASGRSPKKGRIVVRLPKVYKLVVVRDAIESHHSSLLALWASGMDHPLTL